MERRLAAILLTDMVGYSRLMGLDEEGTIARQRTHREKVFDPNISAHGGRVVKTTGDGLLVEFSSVVDAVKCAIEVQTQLAVHDTDIPEDRRIQYRIGINLGDIVIDGDDILGDGVNIAARLEGLAKPGGICISGTVHDQLAGKLDTVFEDTGEQTVKNVPRPVRVWQWQVDRASRKSDNLDEQLPLPDKPSIAVLPFENLSGDPEQEYFADGVAEDIIISLSKLPQLLVIARNSSFTYKSKVAKAQDIADELGVRYVVEGRVRKHGNRVRVSAQLIDCNTGGHLWADRFDRELTDIFAIQDEVTHEIVSAMALKLSADDQRRMVHQITNNLEAYDYFLRGREQHRQMSQDTSAQAKVMLKRTIDFDPNCAAAHALLADSYLLSSINAWDAEPDHSLAEAHVHAVKAVKLDETYPHGHCALAHVELWMRQHDRSIAEYERALALDPSYAHAYVGLGRALLYAGRPAETIEWVERGLRLDPHYSHQNHLYLHVQAQAYFQLGRYEEAIEFLKRRLIRKPDTDISRVLLASSYGHIGRMEDAESEFQEVLRINPNYSLERRKKIFPYKNDEDFDRLVEGLRKAGLPV